MLRRTRQFLPLLLLAAAGAVHAAELGDPRVSSHIGQQLVADIELTTLADAATPVQVHLASPEVYSEAGIAVPPVLSTLNLSVMRRDGRQFLHATTLRPVDADHLHLYLELVDHGRRVVRLATLWLTPDPNPVPAPMPAPMPAPAPGPAPAPVVPAPAAALAHAPAPVHPRVQAEPAPPPLAWARPPAPVRKSVLLPPAPAFAPLPLPVHAAARPAACAPRGGEAEACIALGAKNAELRARIGQLEQRVKGLQASLGAGQQRKAPKPVPAAAPAATPAPAGRDASRPAAPMPAAQKPPALAAPDEQTQRPRPPAHPAGPMPISSIKPLVPHEARAAPPDGGRPWGMIGGGLGALTALGVAAGLVAGRRKRSRNVDIPDQPGVLSGLRERFFERNGGKGAVDPAAGPAAEPTLE